MVVNAAGHAPEAVAGFSISAAMLCATLAADVFTDSRARWTCRAVVCTCLCPSSFPIIVRLSPRASALEAECDEGRGSARPPVLLASVRTAVRGEAAYGLSWFDAHLWAYAEIYGLAEILSEDFQHGRMYGTVRVRNPFVAE